MNTLETRFVVNPELPRGVPVSGPRVIKKYPNRRLYDTAESRYITLADIRRLVVDNVEFVVIDKKSQDDITRSILLQVIADREHVDEPLLSQDFLAQVIRSYGSALQGFIGTYLEQSLKLLSSEQQQLHDNMRDTLSSDACDRINSLTQKNIERWRSVQQDIFRAMSRTASAASARTGERETDPQNGPTPEHN